MPDLGQSVATDWEGLDDAHHILSSDRPGRTLCGGNASKLHTFPPDLKVWPDGNAACWTCWTVQRERLYG